MKVSHKATVRKQASVALAALALFAAAMPGANANYRSSTPADQAVTLIAHLDLPGGSVSQLALQERDGEQYLYVQQASREDFVLVNVTNPSRPGVINRTASPNNASAGRLQFVSGQLALGDRRDTGPAASDSSSSARTVKVLNMSDPANPRTILSFAGVTSTLADDARNLIYVTNGEGLWVLRNNQALAAAAKQHACTSDAAYDELANCQ